MQVPTVAMSSAEFKCLREYLGLTPEWCASYFKVKERAIHRWSGDDLAVPQKVAEQMRRIAEDTDQYVGELARNGDGRVLTYRTDEHFLASRSDTALPKRHRQFASTFPAAWHRAVAARVLQVQPGSTIAFAAATPKIFSTPSADAQHHGHGRFFGAQIIRAGRDMRRTERDITAALCAAYTEVADRHPTLWESKRPVGLVGPFMREYGSTDVYREAIWFFERIDTLGLDAEAWTPGQVAWQVQKPRPTNELGYVQHEDVAAYIYRTLQLR